MKKTEKKRMTLDGLAGMVARGFQTVDKRFDGVESRLDMLEHDVREVKQTVARIDFRAQNQSDAAFADITDLKKRVTVLEKRRS